MATRSVYAPDALRIAEGCVLPVAGEEHRHLAVSRTGSGEEVEVFDGTGRVWPGVVIETRRSETRIRLGPVRTVRPRTAEIILAPALIRNAAFDWMLEKAVELGVAEIVPFRAVRSNETGAGRFGRWQRIVIEATKQSRQYHLPRLRAVSEFEEVLGIAAASRIAFSERGRESLGSAMAGSPVLCLVGPEGGWTEAETDRMASEGLRQVHLGSQILRAETAAVLAVGLIAYELGAL